MSSTSDTTRPTASATPRLLGLLTAAVLLGVSAELAGYLPRPWAYLSQVIYPWLLGAFAFGAAARSLPRAAAGGATFVVTGLVANTTFKWAVYGHPSVRPMLEHEWPAWLTLALLLGGLFGALGRVRAARPGQAAGLAAAALLAAGLAEASADMIGVLPWGTPIALTVLMVTAASVTVVLRGLTTRQLQVAAAAVVAFTLAALTTVPVLQRLVGVA